MERPESNVARGCAGSVLMEGILVLPIYLMLLGVLFIMGDLLRGRMTLQCVERTITWIGGDRYSGHGLDGIMRMLAGYVNKADWAPPNGDLKVDEARHGARVVGNRWHNVFMGYAVTDVKVPWWQGLANTFALIYARDENGKVPFGDSYVLPLGADGDPDRHWRSAVVRRRPDDAGAAYNRNAPGLALADEVRQNVFNDWIEGWSDDDHFHEWAEPTGSHGLSEYRRINGLIVLAE